MGELKAANRPKHQTTITDIAHTLAAMTIQQKADWEPNGPKDSFKIQLGDLQVTLSKAAHTPHPTISVLNAKGQTVDSYTASDFMGTIARTLADMHRMAGEQVFSTKQTLNDAMARLSEKA